jgi:hypothetical protein
MFLEGYITFLCGRIQEGEKLEPTIRTGEKFERLVEI